MSLLLVPIGEDAPRTVNVIIEIPKGSTNKYEMDPELGVMRLDRVLFSPLFYPWDYGFIPQTKYLDGDPVDALVLVQHACYPGVVVDAHPIGVLKMVDGGKPDEKILCVAAKDPRFRDRTSLDNVHSHTLDEIVHFFEVYKQLEEKEVQVNGWENRDAAYQIIENFRLDKNPHLLS